MRVEGLEKPDDAGNVRARHGGARLRVERDAAVVEREPGRGRRPRIRRDHANAGRGDIGLFF